jgi:RNA polymerase sigma-70 factor (ECF subfamily)
VNDETARVLQAQQGSEQAFTELVEAYQSHVYNLCYRMLGEPESAEDAAQETFLRAYQHLERYDRSRPFATWLLSIAAHYCIDRLRRRRFSFSSLDDDQEWGTSELPDVDAPNPEDVTMHRERSRQMQVAIAKLSPTDRAAIVLRYWHDCSEAEIAETLDLSVSAVKSRLHRARRELAGNWQQEEALPARERRPHESPAF